MDSYIIVNFRRERSYLECQAEVEQAESEGREMDSRTVERFVGMGAITMNHVPDVGRFIFLDGVQYQVKDQAWSAHLSLSEEPNFHDPEVLITVALGSNHTSGFAPQEDFRQ